MIVDFVPATGLLTGQWHTANTTSEPQHFHLEIPTDQEGTVDQIAPWSLVYVTIKGPAAQNNFFKTVPDVPLFAVSCGGQPVAVAFGDPSLVSGGGNPGAGTITNKSWSNAVKDPTAPLPLEGYISVHLTGMLSPHTSVEVMWMVDLSSE